MLKPIWICFFGDLQLRKSLQLQIPISLISRFWFWEQLQRVTAKPSVRELLIAHQGFGLYISALGPSTIFIDMGSGNDKIDHGRWFIK